MTRLIYRGNSFNPPRPVLRSIILGFDGRCPSCGEGRILSTDARRLPACVSCTQSWQSADTSSCVALVAGVVAAIAGGVAAYALAVTELPDLVIILLAAGVAMLTAFALVPRVSGAFVAFSWAMWVGEFDPDLARRYPDRIARPRVVDTGILSVAPWRLASLRTKATEPATRP